MTIVRHPSLSAQYDVPDSKVSEWVASGWIAEPPEPSESPPKPTHSPRPRKTARRSSKTHRETS